MASQMNETAQLRELLCSAIAEEHRLHEAAAREASAARRWQMRAALAERKEAPDLAEAARQHAARHEQRARAYQAECRRSEAQIAELKATLVEPAGPDRARPPVVLNGADAVARRLAALEREDRVERDLAELKRRLGRE